MRKGHGELQEERCTRNIKVFRLSFVIRLNNRPPHHTTLFSNKNVLFNVTLIVSLQIASFWMVMSSHSQSPPCPLFRDPSYFSGLCVCVSVDEIRFVSVNDFIIHFLITILHAALLFSSLPLNVVQTHSPSPQTTNQSKYPVTGNSL